MEHNELILDYFRIVVEMRGLGEKIPDSEVAAKLHRLVFRKFNANTSSIEQFQ